eukprot:UN00597
MTNDAKEGLMGALCPLGGAFGYKGTGLGTMVDILSGALSGAETGKRITGTATTTKMNTSGSFFMFINPEISCDNLDDFYGNVDKLVADLTNAGPNVLLPGQKEFESEQAAEKDGLKLSSATQDMLENLETIKK